MNDLKYVYIPVSVLEKNNISKDAFFQDTIIVQNFLNNFLDENFPFSVISNIFYTNECFILALKNVSSICFKNDSQFNAFISFINTTKFANMIDVCNKKREISILSDIPPIFFNLLYEFLV